MLVVCLALIAGRRDRAASTWLARPRLRWLILAPIPAIVCYFIVQIAAWYVGSFIVKPNQLVREQPYIAYNIDFTRQAYALDRLAQHEFPAETTSKPPTPPTIRPRSQNIRLWDWHALQDTLRQIQEIRTYYDFPDIDIDRYQIDGQMRAGDAGRARDERGETAREQPQLDQRKAHLHARLRHHHEPGERLHAGRPADAAC